jgi:hypothetical protein
MSEKFPPWDDETKEVKFQEFDEKQFPSWVEQGKNLKRSVDGVIRAVVSNRETLLVPDHIKNERLEICSTCEWISKNKSRCKSCGCILKIKTSFAIDACPEGKWGEWENK